MTDTEATAGHLCTGPSCWECGEPTEIRHLRQEEVMPALYRLRQERPDADHHALAQAATKALRPALMRLLHAETDLRQNGNDLEEAARWIVAMGYPYDWSRGGGAPALPRGLREAIIDVAHEDADGRFHGKSLDRDGARAWLAAEDDAFELPSYSTAGSRRPAREG
jgi:hypothetical protein